VLAGIDRGLAQKIVPVKDRSIFQVHAVDLRACAAAAHFQE